jgi:signal transduction histidine kinase
MAEIAAHQNVATAEMLKAALKKVDVLADLPDDQIDWIIANTESERFQEGEVLIREGDPADSMLFILEGEGRFQRESLGPDAPVGMMTAGHVTGMLPFSRMTHFMGTARALTPVWIARMRTDKFPEMLQRIPVLGTRLVGVMSDRIRETTKNEQQRDKLMALGKLSAGLAHEINNPAAAATRAAGSLREALEALADANRRLDHRELNAEQRAFITQLEANAVKSFETPQRLDPVEAADREEELGAWLEAHGSKNAWMHAPLMAEGGVTVERLEWLATQLEHSILNDVFDRIGATVTANKLAAEIQHSISRIVDLVTAVKEYSYMDQAPEQEIDLHDGLDSTLKIMEYKLRKNLVDVKREYDRSLPKVCAFGRELNQIWTNLIDNAADAMKNGGALQITTMRDGPGFVIVDVRDSGAGIPAEVRLKIFDPFFTTKAVGEGTGLGLDTVMRILRKHRGSIAVESKPGETHFRVRLPSTEPQ